MRQKVAIKDKNILLKINGKYNDISSADENEIISVYSLCLVTTKK
jgi:hypothetical protein